MIIRVPLRFEGSKSDKILYALFDSGATYSCITEEIAGDLAHLETLHTHNEIVHCEQRYLYGDP